MVDRFVTRVHRRYEVLSPGAIYEAALQSIVEQHLAALWPGWVGKKIDPLFETAAGDVQPDLVLLRPADRKWALVEVEIEGHSAKTHILPQLSKLVRARGDERLAAKLVESGITGLSLDEVERIVTQKPAVFLVTHGSTLRFLDKVEELGVQALDITVHSHPPNDYVLEVADYSPSYVALGCLARRVPRSLTPYLWTVVGPLPRAILDRTSVWVEAGDTSAYWGLRHVRDGVILRQPTDLPLGDDLVEGKVEWNPERVSLRIGVGETS